MVVVVVAVVGEVYPLVVYTTDSTGAETAACTHNAVVVFIICGGYSWLYYNPGTLLHVS